MDFSLLDAGGLDGFPDDALPMTLFDVFLHGIEELQNLIRLLNIVNLLSNHLLQGTACVLLRRGLLLFLDSLRLVVLLHYILFLQYNPV